jgi:hypothetical protein
MIQIERYVMMEFRWQVYGPRHHITTPEIRFLSMWLNSYAGCSQVTLLTCRLHPLLMADQYL